MRKLLLTCTLTMQLITLSFAQDLTGKATYHLTLGEDRHIFVGNTLFDANASLFTYKQYPKKSLEY